MFSLNKYEEHKKLVLNLYEKTIIKRLEQSEEIIDFHLDSNDYESAFNEFEKMERYIENLKVSTIKEFHPLVYKRFSELEKKMNEREEIPVLEL